MFYIASKLLAFLSKPLFWIFLFLISAIIFNKYRKRILVCILAIFYLLSNNFLADKCSQMWETPRHNIKENYDIGIVLGGIIDYDNITKAYNFNKNADRIIEAQQLYNQGKIKKILISGGNGMLLNDGYIEANGIRNYLLLSQIPTGDILIENTSRNTKENAFNSSRILKKESPDGRFLLITSAIHMKRAQFCFEKAGITTTAFPTDCTKSYNNLSLEYILLPKIEALEKWEDLIHEYIGFLAYRLAF